MKYLYVTFSDGNTFRIPIGVIAKSRAWYYACNVDGFEEDSKEYLDELKFSLEDTGELISWACNNMNWEDVEEYKELVKSENRHIYTKEWSNASKVIAVG